MRDACSDADGSHSISFSYIPIDNPNNLIISIGHPEDRVMWDFIKNNYPQFFAVPIIKYRSLDPIKLRAQKYQWAEINQASHGIIDTFFLVDYEVGIMAKVKKDALYQVSYIGSSVIEEKDYIEDFPDQYEAYIIATNGLRKKLNCL